MGWALACSSTDEYLVVKQDVIVIGASAGGVEALSILVSYLPADLPASVFVTLHTPAEFHSELPAILTRAGPLPASHPASGEATERGRIYVAPPDRHLLIEDGHIHLWKGPKENRHRPAINPLFRSAAFCCGPRVAGVILSGTLDDGSAGLWLVKRHGGTALVQDPALALFPEMIKNAMEYVDIDYVVSLSRMGPLLASLAAGRGPQGDVHPIQPSGEEVPRWTREHQSR